MTAKEWRAARDQELTLPSGLGVIVKKASLMQLAIQGQIPTPLVGIVEEFLNNKEFKLKLSDVPSFGSMVHAVVKACLVSPAIADTADDNHITLDELSYEDCMAIFNWANGDATALAPFREEQIADNNPRRAGAEIPPETIGNSSD